MDSAGSGFAFLDPGPLVDDDLELVLVERREAEPAKQWAPSYRFEMRIPHCASSVGRIDLRVGHSRRLELYAGHIGYCVEPEHRGHRYAARSCRLLFPLARMHGLTPLIITCDPGNLASRRTCELAGARLMGIVKVPRGDELYALGQYWKCRYRIHP